MAVKKENLGPDSQAAPRQPIELITDNGFSIFRFCDLDRASAPAFGKYAFLVRDPHGYELEITVELDPKAANEIVARSTGRISRDSSFWLACAERHLADYLWENDDYPPGANLIVTQLSPTDCDLAIRWGAAC